MGRGDGASRRADAGRAIGCSLHLYESPKKMHSGEVELYAMASPLEALRCPSGRRERVNERQEQVRVEIKVRLTYCNADRTVCRDTVMP